MKFFISSCTSLLWVVFLVSCMADEESSEEAVEEEDALNADDSKEFCYDDSKGCGPRNWPGSCQGGQYQSPINLPYDPRDHRRNARLADLSQSNNYFNEQRFNLTNNGHTVQVSLQDDLTSTCLLDGSLLNNQPYVFSQLHFHWGSSDDRGSEHTLTNGGYNYAFPMEAHLVHYSAEFNSFTEALNSNKYGAIAVVGVFFEPADRDNNALTPIINAMRNVRNPKTKTGGSRLNLSWFLFQSDQKDVDIIQYYGSLTTPNCNEGVLWNVVAFPAPISYRQMRSFRTMVLDSEGKNLVNNYRPIQPTNSNRKIYAVRSSVKRRQN